jgi:outer membrane lipoprotein-sorting protein
MLSKAAFPFRAVLCGAVVLFLAAAVFLAPPSSSAADGKELLRRLGVTAREMNYRGQQMVIDFSRLTPQVTRLSVVYQQGGNERREYHGSQSISVIDGDYFYQYHPARSLVVKRKLPGEGGFDSLRKESLEQTLASYHLESSSSEPIAGRAAHMYAFLPKEAGSRPGRKVWVDVETGLILRMEIYSPDEKLFWLSVFEDIEYTQSVNPASFTMPIPAGVRVVEVGEERCSSPAEAETIAGLPLTLPEYLPDGFARKCIRALRSMSHGEIKVLYSDGLSLLTIFESSRFRPFGGAGSGLPVRVGESPASLHSMGLVSALNWESPGVYLTILGELSRQELLKVAGSVRPFREHSRP